MTARFCRWLSRGLLTVGIAAAAFTAWLIRAAFVAPETLADPARNQLITASAVWIAGAIPTTVALLFVLRIFIALDEMRRP